jgi:hypothetical protein
VSERDDTSRNRVATFKTSGVGVNITQNCYFCEQPRDRLGGRTVGRLRLFRCALCVAEKAKKEAIQ